VSCTTILCRFSWLHVLLVAPVLSAADVLLLLLFWLQLLSTADQQKSTLRHTLWAAPTIIRGRTILMPGILDQWRRPYTAGPLTAAEFEQYWSLGYVVKHACLQQQDLQPSLEAIDR
jgi:hypothetical protein